MNRIYETDSYKKTLRTSVKDCGIDDRGRSYVELEETIFFPEEGGQNADTGVLVIEGQGGPVEIPVVDGIITGRNTCSSVSGEEEIRIRYIISDSGRPESRDTRDTKQENRNSVKDMLRPGTSVLCKLDWPSRFDRMQNHTGEHILSGIMHSRYGVDNVGFHLSDTGPVTLDFNRQVSYEDVIKAQDEANRAIYLNLPVTVSFPSGEELMDIDYRSKIDIDGQVRLVTIGYMEAGSVPDTDTPAETDIKAGSDIKPGPGAAEMKNKVIDICACCAPHVAHTGEVGIIKVLSVINWKGGIRVSILCGRRALEYINKEHDIISETARKMSTEMVNIPRMTDSYRDGIVKLKAELAGVREKALLDEVGRMYTASDREPCVEGSADGEVVPVIFTDDDLPAPVMKNIYNALTDKFEGFTGVFAGDDEKGYRYNAGSRNLDSRILADKLKEAFGAKGGGSPDMIQGKISATKESITELLRNIRN